MPALETDDLSASANPEATKLPGRRHCAWDGAWEVDLPNGQILPPPLAGRQMERRVGPKNTTTSAQQCCWEMEPHPTQTGLKKRLHKLCRCSPLLEHLPILSFADHDSS